MIVTQNRSHITYLFETLAHKTLFTIEWQHN